MQVIFGGRNEGKTTKLIEWLKQEPFHVLIVFSTQEKQRLIKQYAEKELSNNEQLPSWVERIFTPFEFSNSHGKLTGKEKVAVDNADIILQQMLRRPISIISLTKEDNEKAE